ncbi:sugar transferase, PEP-CTERM system associated/exopolysaccharide biosynthesis polyprenyl glycosylphosphotransferase [Desulfoluna spongiiphila]|uniref:Sugar transferase, PEP-CTERM system associated/exopolysaccharide biosynthesis polyprenyl glycosylphosphotransferase n=2 Tax=Desulfoluna spongiiphila TaxID=419481 RepID=A0A1G5BY76_9BACT|nr:sugar transferase, PEP-CTERM system associated/exopolysaccharide biosynthesis polyprenyl glycosylphosphotransferase [Desulfoluna spongiiphila]VVS93979.1 exopolysaccharide biosynthesis polyprenyl glycosylphosphotransferase [Desulfoluna spongiiphila]
MINVFRSYYTIRNLFLIMLESVLLYLCILFSATLFAGGEGAGDLSGLSTKAGLVVSTCIFCLYCNNIYSLKDTNGYADLAFKLFQSFGAAMILLAMVYAAFNQAIIGTKFFFVYIPVVVAILSIWRFFYVYLLKSGVLSQSIYIIGDSDLAIDICRETEAEIDCGYRVKGILSRNPLKGMESVTAPHINTYDNLAATAKANGIKRIVVALKEKRGNFPIDELLLCRVSGIDVVEGNTFYEMLTGKFLVSSINPTWLIFSNGFKKSRIRNIFKRLEDLFASVILLALFSPLILVTALLIKWDSKGPVLFSQDRLGIRHKPYRLYKFRSMVENAEGLSGPVWASREDPRVTRVGKFIRTWRIDELPQLFNVLKGDMSLVGPRPEREHFVKQLEAQVPYYAERFIVRPGVTGWAQVRYEYGDSVEDAMEKLNYDLFYIKNMSIFMDVVIVCRTIRTVLFGVGAR